MARDSDVSHGWLPVWRSSIRVDQGRHINGDMPLPNLPEELRRAFYGRCGLPESYVPHHDGRVEVLRVIGARPTRFLFTLRQPDLVGLRVARAVLR